MLKAVLEYTRRELRLPEIDGEACVYALLETATCQACVDACPRQAWSLDDESLGIDTARCDGCGLCAPACPQGAIVHAYAPLRRRWKARRLAFVACEFAGLPQSTGVMPCLHALGMRDLLKLYREGFRYLVQAEVDCDDCARAKAQRLGDLVARINAMLASRALPGMRLRVVPKGKWRHMLSNANGLEPGPRLDRRGFMRRALGTGLNEGLKAAGLTDRHAPPDHRGTLLPRVSERDIMPFVPEIDQTRCSGCDACARICPHGAITLRETDDTSDYIMDAGQCTGCGMCVDVCDQNAVLLHRHQAQRQTALALVSKICPLCKVPFHLPVTRSRADDHCHICDRATRYKDQYQF